MAMDKLVYGILGKQIKTVASGLVRATSEGTKLTLYFTNGDSIDISFPEPEDGVSIEYIDVDDNNNLIVTLSDGRTILAGQIKTVQGEGAVIVDSELSDTSENPVQNKVISAELDAIKNSIPDTSGFATKEDLENLDVPAGDVDLSNYYNKTEVDGMIPDISNLATKEDLENLDIPTGDVDLSNYYNKAEVDSKIPDVSNLATKEEIPDVSNLASKDEIPSLEGYAKTEDIPVSDKVTINASTKNWEINGVDTGICSEGKKGDKGDQGIQGVQGVPGAIDRTETVLWSGKAYTKDQVLTLSAPYTNFSELAFAFTVNGTTTGTTNTFRHLIVPVSLLETHHTINFDAQPNVDIGFKQIALQATSTNTLTIVKSIISSASSNTWNMTVDKIIGIKY